MRYLTFIGQSLSSYLALAAGFGCLAYLSTQVGRVQSPSIGAWEGVAESLVLVAKRDSKPSATIKVPKPPPLAEDSADSNTATLPPELDTSEPETSPDMKMPAEDDTVPVVGKEPAETEPKDTGPPWVVVDAGHGGQDGGSVHNGIIERTLTLDIAERVEAHLKKAGLRVKMTRSTNVYVDLEERSEIANRTNAAAFVSIHLNANLNSSVSGLEVYYSPQKTLRAKRLLQAALKLDHIQGLEDGRSERLATAVQNAASSASGARNRGIRERGYTVVIGSSMPAVLVECGFISNPSEAAKIKTTSYREKLAQGIAKGVTTYLQAQAGNPMRDIFLAEPKVEDPPPEELMGPPSPFIFGPPRPPARLPEDSESSPEEPEATDESLPKAA